MVMFFLAAQSSPATAYLCHKSGPKGGGGRVDGRAAVSLPSLVLCACSTRTAGG